MIADDFTSFKARLPSARDALDGKHVEALEPDGAMRLVLWDWIPPTHVQAAELWLANGFTAWRRKALAQAQNPDVPQE